MQHALTGKHPFKARWKVLVFCFLASRVLADHTPSFPSNPGLFVACLAASGCHLWPENWMLVTLQSMLWRHFLSRPRSSCNVCCRDLQACGYSAVSPDTMVSPFILYLLVPLQMCKSSVSYKSRKSRSRRQLTAVRFEDIIHFKVKRCSGLLWTLQFLFRYFTFNYIKILPIFLPNKCVIWNIVYEIS